MTEYQSSFERIERTTQIHFVLNKLIEGRRQVAVQLPQGQETYNSLLLHVDENLKMLHLDLLKSVSPLKNNCMLLLKSQLHGVEITFHSQIRETIQNAAQSYHRIVLPQYLNYLQRRTDFRLPLNKAFAPKVTFVTRENQRMEGGAENISLGGLRAVFTDPKICYWQEGERIPNCIVQLNAKEHIMSAIEVRNSHYDRQQKLLVVGCRFINLGNLQQHTITRYMAAADRELRRKGVA